MRSTGQIISATIASSPHAFRKPRFDRYSMHNLLNETAALIEAGTLKTTLTTHLGKINAANLKRAHKLLEGGHTLGKIVLEGF